MGETFSLYEDIKNRTNGEIYLGVVGPVRTGKSTFIKRFMEQCVLPSINDEHAKVRAMDEMPQSAAGTMIMTTEPKFIPSDSAATFNIDGGSVKVKVVDCVGFVVDGANGTVENGKDRMVNTPWSELEIPFSKAAEIGTKKVIEEHSTIGIVITTDGSFSDIERSSFIPAEEKAINELKQINKPFVVLLNCVKPYSKEAINEAERMSEKYKVKVLPVNCEQLKKEDVEMIIQGVLKEFPVSMVEFYMPAWVEILDDDHWLKKELIEYSMDVINSLNVMKDVDSLMFLANQYIENVEVKSSSLSNGTIKLEYKMNSELYYQIISELTGTKIDNEYELISIIKDLSDKKSELEGLSKALSDVNMSGFGVVTPIKEDIELAEPEVIKNGSKYGVRIKAKVPSINMLKTQINVEIAPIVGTKNQADDLIDYIKSNMKDESLGIWETNIFGKTVEQIVNDGIYEKTHNMTKESMDKISETLEKVMNENSGLVCFIV